MKISVIIPAYNAEETIGETLSSVFAQTYKDFEIIVVDDCSSDSTVEACHARGVVVESRHADGVINLKSFNDNANANRETNHPITQSSNILLLRQEENQGPAAARNRGIREARGEWIAFLDADDKWLPEKLEMQMNVVSNNCSAVMIFGLTVSFADVCLAEAHLLPSEVLPTHSTRISKSLGGVFLERYGLRDFAVLNPVPTSTVLLKKSVVEEVGCFDEQFCGPEDYDLWIRIAAHHEVICINTALSRYRGKVGSLSMDDRKFLPEVLRVIDKAYATGGCFSNMQEKKDAAVMTQLNHASWMAFCRGARGTAIGYLVRSQLLAIRSYGKTGVAAPDAFWPLLLRYIFGKGLVNSEW